MSQACSVDGCGMKVNARGWCSTHYSRWRKTGSTDYSPPSMEDRFWSKVQKDDGCWEWTGALFGGYGSLSVGGRAGRPVAAHRISYKIHHGEIPAGLDIDHMCHNHSCVNPAHLQAVSRKENLENRDPRSKRGRSGIRGVAWHGASKKWAVSVSHHNKPVYGGLFSDLKEAERAAIELRGQLYTNSLTDRRVS